MSKKFVYLFSEGDASMRELLGGKGANLAEMTHIGLPVPQGFTISTEACTKYYEDGKKINDEIQAQIMEYIVKMEEITGKKFGDKVILEDMNYISSFTVVPAWFDTLLTRRYARDDESEESLHILRNNCVYDIGLYYNFGDLRSGILDVDPQTSNISRNYARLEKAVKAHIKKIYADFDEFK